MRMHGQTAVIDNGFVILSQAAPWLPVVETALGSGAGAVSAFRSNAGTHSSSPPPMHQNSRVKTRSETEPPSIESLRYARKISDGRGLCLLVMPNGGRYRRYNYRFDGKPKTLALGVHPDVSLDKARARHQVARTLLADGVDPSARKRVLGNQFFAMPIGEPGDFRLSICAQD
jgi:hypothetical protein